MYNIFVGYLSDALLAKITQFLLQGRIKYLLYKLCKQIHFLYTRIHLHRTVKFRGGASCLFKI